MTKIFRAFIVTLASAILTACGGGSESNSSDADPTSYWTMDSHQYINGGHSAVSTSSPNGVLVTTAVVSTATLSGGDTSNGAYSGSALTFAFKGEPVTGVYTVVPDRASFVAADVSAAPILVEVTVGVATTTGTSQYTASSGQVHVTRDTSGVYHFTSVATMPAAKTVDVLGGVAGAPATMTLTIVDAY
jgi:hypothetical protein